MWITPNKAQLGVCFKVTPIQLAVPANKETAVSPLLYRKGEPVFSYCPLPSL